MWQSVFTTLSSLAPRFLPHQADLVNLFLLFLRDHYFAKRPDDPFLRSYKGDALIRTPTYCCVDGAASAKEVSARLLTFLRLFQGLGASVRSLYGHAVLRSVFYALLLRPESDVQKLAVEILCNDLPEGEASSAGERAKSRLEGYRERLLALCEDRSLRECITTFFIAPEEGMVQKDDRAQLIPVLSRLLYGRLVSRQAVSRSSFAARQSAVLFYLSTLPAEELSEFVAVSTASLYEGELRPHPRSDGEVDALVARVRARSPALRRLYASLTLMYEVIRHLGTKLSGYVHVYLAIIAYTLQLAVEFDAMKTAKRQAETAGRRKSGEGEMGSGSGNENGNGSGNENETENKIENETENENENENHMEVESGKENLPGITDTSKQTSDFVHQLRTLALRRLTECIGHYPAVNYTLYSHYFFTPLSSSLQLLPHSVYAVKKPPVLIHLAFIISSNASLYYLYNLQPLLIPQVIACLVTQSSAMEVESEQRTASGIRKGAMAHQVGHLSMPVAQEIVRIFENLLKIDPERDLFNEEKKPKKNAKGKKTKLENWKRESAEMDSMQVGVGLKGAFHPEGVEASEDHDGLEFLLPHMSNMIRGLEYLLSMVRSVRGNFFNRRVARIA